MDNFAYVTTGGFDTTIGSITYIIGHPFVMMWWGMLIHFGKEELDNAIKEARKPSWAFLIHNPLKTVVSIVSAFAAYVLVMPSAEGLGVVSDQVLNIMRLTGFGVGYACDSIAGTIADEAIRKRIPMLGTKQPPQP